MKMHSPKPRISKVVLLGAACTLVIAGICLALSTYAQQSNAVGGIEGEDLCTPGNSCNITSPTVSLTAPTNNATVSGCAVTVSADASDNVGVASVQFQLDGSNLGPSATSSPYSYTWSTLGTSNSNHTLTAIATDTSNNQTTSSPVTVTVNNTATVAGDLNCDGHVNIFDLSIFLNHWQQQGTGLPEDFNKDGVVNIFDLSILLSHYGM